jgi:hypothetical protein
MRETSDEREVLRSERRRLGSEHALLRREGEDLVGSADVAALHVHVERLRRHQAALQAYTVALESFHRRFGPLD